MPTYEYRCPAGHEFEKFYRKISDAGAEVPCPQCNQIAQRKISAGAGLVFKGSGFYITDYGKDGKKDQPSASRPKARGDGGGDAVPAGSGESAGSGDAKTGGESKPAAADAKSAAPKEAPKSDTSPAKPSKPSKPSTE